VGAERQRKAADGRSRAVRPPFTYANTLRCLHTPRRRTHPPRRSFVAALPGPLSLSAPSSLPASPLPGAPRSPPPLPLGEAQAVPAHGTRLPPAPGDDGGSAPTRWSRFIRSSGGVAARPPGRHARPHRPLLPGGVAPRPERGTLAPRQPSGLASPQPSARSESMAASARVRRCCRSPRSASRITASWASQMAGSS
jgi:hypothetical protein